MSRWRDMTSGMANAMNTGMKIKSTNTTTIWEKNYQIPAMFNRCGRKILCGRDCEEDDDFPELVGKDILLDMANRALKYYDLDNGSIEIDFMTHEKGLLDVYFTDTTKKTVKLDN